MCTSYTTIVVINLIIGIAIKKTPKPYFGVLAFFRI